MTNTILKKKKEKIPLLQSTAEIVARAREISDIDEPYYVAVAAAHDDAVIEAIVNSQKERIAHGILIGDSIKIKELIEQFGANPDEFKIVHSNSDEESGNIAARAASTGEANVILKGILSTGKLLKNVLKKEYGLRREGGLLSHTAVLSPKRYPKLLAVTDGGMIIKPTFEQKIEMIRNSVVVCRAMGIDIPKVVALTPIDRIVKAFPETFEAAALSKMAERGQIKSCIIDGPMSLDTAVYPPTAEYQGITSPVAGQADIVLANSIEEANILAKSLVQFGGATFAGVILGANVPIALVSRADNAASKLASIALAVVVAHYIHTR
ncbi:MAG: phosphate butyryltransferase [Calditrichaeota bacterium]|jgi:phosphate butyryltransferase|nr:phosphate butyryltransferase [Calditrichota bacterium]MBT7618560.1 phosphate butyryltransferase [Calditrichota bacterium]MBT7788570.1 phosphate butyryltransferase [Calditrichota bacterium]